MGTSNRNVELGLFDGHVYIWTSLLISKKLPGLFSKRSSSRNQQRQLIFKFVNAWEAKNSAKKGDSDKGRFTQSSTPLEIPREI